MAEYQDAVLFQDYLHDGIDGGDKDANENNRGNDVVSKAAMGEVAFSIFTALHTKSRRNYASNNRNKARFLGVVVGICHL
jgi:hypothetical protein